MKQFCVYIEQALGKKFSKRFGFHLKLKKKRAFCF